MHENFRVRRNWNLFRDGVSKDYSIRYSSVVTGYLGVENRQGGPDLFPVAARFKEWV